MSMANCGRARVAGSANVATSTRSLGSGVAYVTRQYFVIVRPRTKIAVPPTRSKIACSIADHEQYAQHCPGSLPHHRTNSLTWGRPYGWQYSLPLIIMPSADQFPVRGTIRRCDGPSGFDRRSDRSALSAIRLCRPYMTLVNGVLQSGSRQAQNGVDWQSS
jgi:hypothetical protein